ncbi:MAG: sulfurtransferase TusA family protein [Thiomicrorhabdus sp.]|nr:sulfurtransferase TusA family protein [Thiomicrorhabdus sp.]
MNQSTNQANCDFFVDAKGLKCPMPVIKLQQQTRLAIPGNLIAIACTDPGAEKDINSWCKVNKHQVISANSTEYGCEILVKVKGALQNQS